MPTRSSTKYMCTSQDSTTAGLPACLPACLPAVVEEWINWWHIRNTPTPLLYVRVCSTVKLSCRPKHYPAGTVCFKPIDGSFQRGTTSFAHDLQYLDEAPAQLCHCKDSIIQFAGYMYPHQRQKCPNVLSGLAYPLESRRATMLGATRKKFSLCVP